MISLARQLKTTYTYACQSGALAMVANWKQPKIYADRVKSRPSNELCRNPLLYVWITI